MSHDTAGAHHARPAAVDAGPLGYLALGLTLLAFGLLRTGIVGDAVVKDAASLALLVGGVTLFLAGMWELRSGRAYTGTAFAGLGAFWAAWSMGPGGSTNTDATGLFLLLWALLALTLAVAGRTGGMAAPAVFGLLALALVLLAIGPWAGSSALGTVGGWVAAVAGLLSWYGGTAALTNAAWGRAALPMR